MDRLTKQGGPLSPLKSTMTTSLGHCYLDDLSLTDDGTLIIRSSKHNEGDPHLSEGAPSVQISIRYADNIVTLYRLRRPSGRPADYT